MNPHHPRHRNDEKRGLPRFARNDGRGGLPRFARNDDLSRRRDTTSRRHREAAGRGDPCVTKQWRMTFGVQAVIGFESTRPYATLP